MTVAVIVQARLGSERHPNKVLLPLPSGRVVVDEVLYRCKQIHGVDRVVLAIPDTDHEWNILVSHGGRADHLTVGSEWDVLGRYAQAAAEVGADTVVRITADCPLLNPEVCSKVLAAYQVSKVGYCSNGFPRTWPQGYDCEVFPAELLYRANAEVAQVPCPPREHVTPYIREHLAAGNTHNVVSDGENRSHIQWSLDTAKDYWRIWDVMEEQMGEAA